MMAVLCCRIMISESSQMKTNKHVSKVTDKFVSYLKRNKIASASRVANSLLVDRETYRDNQLVVRITQHSPLRRALTPTQTASSLRDKLRALDIIGDTVGIGGDSWTFLATDKLLKIREELDLEYQGQKPVEVRLAALEKDNRKLNQNIQAIWDAIADIQANNPPVTTEKIQRHLSIVN